MIPLTREAGVAPAPMLPALHLTQPLTYLSSGSQTDVYCTADRRYVLKLKSVARRAGAAQQRAAQLKQLADALYAHFGSEHGLRMWFLVLADAMGQPLVVGVQPFLEGARPLDAIAIDGLTRDNRAILLAQLRTIISRSLASYRSTGRVADLYGYGRKAGAEARRWDPRRLLAEGWRLIAQRPLLTAHNLMLTQDGRVVLVDYDPICPVRLGCRLMYAARVLLLLRDRWQLGVVSRTLPARLAGSVGQHVHAEGLGGLPGNEGQPG